MRQHNPISARSDNQGNAAVDELHYQECPEDPDTFRIVVLLESVIA